MSDTPDFLSHRLLNEGGKTSAFFAELTPADWDKTVYDEGVPWTIRQVLAHFVSTEANLILLVKDIASGGSGAPEDFNIDTFNLHEVAGLESASLAELKDQFLQYRRQSAAWIACLSLADLEKQGRHPYLGYAPLAEIIKLIYRHNQIHQRDIRKLLT